MSYCSAMARIGSWKMGSAVTSGTRRPPRYTHGAFFLSDSTYACPLRAGMWPCPFSSVPPLPITPHAEEVVLRDHFVRPHQQQVRHRQPEGFRGREVDHELEPGGLLDRKIRRLRASEDLVHQVRGPAV